MCQSQEIHQACECSEGRIDADEKYKKYDVCIFDKQTDPILYNHCALQGKSFVWVIFHLIYNRLSLQREKNYRTKTR